MLLIFHSGSLISHISVDALLMIKGVSKGSTWLFDASFIKGKQRNPARQHEDSFNPESQIMRTLHSSARAVVGCSVCQVWALSLSLSRSRSLVLSSGSHSGVIGYNGAGTWLNYSREKYKRWEMERGMINGEEKVGKEEKADESSEYWV